VVIVESLRGKTGVAWSRGIRPSSHGKTTNLVACRSASLVQAKCGDSTNRVTVSIGDPNTPSPIQGLLVNLYKGREGDGTVVPTRAACRVKQAKEKKHVQGFP
jgi:formate dehydrogenase major subunit